MFDEITAFSFPTRILFGCGAVGHLPGALKEVEISKPLVVTDPGVRSTSAFEATVGALKGAGVLFEVFSGVHGNPIEDDVLEAANLYRSGGCDGAIGLGGGSAIDVAK